MRFADRQITAEYLILSHIQKRKLVHCLCCLFCAHLVPFRSGPYGALQCRSAYFLLHFVNSQRRCRGEPDWG